MLSCNKGKKQNYGLRNVTTTPLYKAPKHCLALSLKSENFQAHRMRVERNLEDAKFNSYFPPENSKGRMNQRNQHLSSLRHVGWGISNLAISFPTVPSK